MVYSHSNVSRLVNIHNPGVDVSSDNIVIVTCFVFELRHASVVQDESFCQKDFVTSRSDELRT